MVAITATTINKSAMQALNEQGAIPTEKATTQTTTLMTPANDPKPTGDSQKNLIKKGNKPKPKKAPRPEETGSEKPRQKTQMIPKMQQTQHTVVSAAPTPHDRNAVPIASQMKEAW